MPIAIRNLEWLNHNSQRAYPLAADTTRKDVTGTFKLPDNFIVGLVLPVHWGISVDASKFFIRKLSIYTTGYSITVGYASDSGDIDVATAVFSKSAHTDNQTYSLGGMGDFADSRGFITIGYLDQIEKQPAGYFTFTYQATKLEVDTIKPHIRGVMSMQVQNGSQLSKEITGKVRLVAGKNARLTLVETPGEDPRIVIDAIEGSGLTDTCICTDTATPIKTINGIAPDANSNFQFVGNDCLQVVAGNHLLEFQDTCSQPCCGCKELEAVTSALEAFGEKATTLENFLVNLEVRVSQMDMIVLGSKLGDRGCSTNCT